MTTSQAATATRRQSAPFQAWLDAAGPRRPAVWRVLIGLVIVVIFWAVFTALVLAGVVVFYILSGLDASAALAALDRLMGTGVWGTAIALSGFAGIWIGLEVALRLLHGRSVYSLVRPRDRRPEIGFATGALLGLGLYLLTLAIACLLVGAPARTDVGIAQWAIWFLPLAGLVLIQAGGEEALFRGYLGQELARRFRHPFAWAVLPSMLFGVLHFSPGLPGLTGLLYVLVTFLFGLAAATLVWRTGALSAAIGLHVAMNMCGITLAGLEGLAGGGQLFVFPEREAEILFLADLAATAGLLVFVLSPSVRFLGEPVFD